MPFDIPVHNPCPFCENVASRDVVSSQDGTIVKCAVVEVLEETFSFLSPRQISPPHILVIPKRHAATVLDLTSAETAAVARHAHRLAAAVVKAFQPAGLNIYQNNGAGAGQTVGHYHVHVVPRYFDGRDNRVLSAHELPRTPFEELLVLADRLKNALGP